MLIKYNADINARDKRGNSPLHLATLLNNTETMRILLSYSQTNVNLPNTAGQSPLVIALRHANDATINLLIDYNADPNVKQGITPLLYAIRKADVVMMRRLFALNANPNAMYDGTAPFHVAAEQQSKTMIDLILKEGGNIDIQVGAHYV